MYATKNRRRNGKGSESENEFIINIGASFVNTDLNSPGAVRTICHTECRCFSSKPKPFPSNDRAVKILVRHRAYPV